MFTATSLGQRLYDDTASLMNALYHVNEFALNHVNICLQTSLHLR